MRLSARLCKQNIDWHFKQRWKANRVRKVEDTGAEKLLLEKGYTVHRAEDILDHRPRTEPFTIIGMKPKLVGLDHTHPNWHDDILLTYKDNNVLLEGLNQAKILTNTVQVKDGLPESIALKSSKQIDKRVKEIILASHVFDAQQVKLPKIKDPERPAWNFPRVYGISQARVINLLLTNLLRLIENNSDLEVVAQRSILEDTHFCYNFQKLNNTIQFDLKGDVLVTSTQPLKPISSEPTDNLELPNIDPISPVITLNEENIYQIRGIYPVDLKFTKSHPHTLFVPHLEQEVKNVYEEPITDSQIEGRSLLKAFTVAASYAKEKYGDVKNLERPVTVQCVHTNGHLFHFGIFQLNTLDLETDGVRNVWYQTERIPLFEVCTYKVGKPVLQGYNNQVVQYLSAFYNNV